MEGHDFHLEYFDGKLHKMAKLYQRQLHIFAGERGLSPGQPPVLITLQAHNGCTQKELCQFITIKPATMTDILQRMEKSNLIYRQADEKDQRVSRVYLGEKGISFLKEAEQIGKQLEQECFQAFTQEERILFLSFMDRIIENLQTGLNPHLSGGDVH